MKLAKLKFGRFGTILLFLMLSLLVVLPVFFMLSKSFMSTREILYSQTVNAYTPLKMIPERLSLEQYKAALILDPEFYFYFWNSVFLVVPILAGNLVLSTLAAYGFSKFRFWGKRPLYFLFVFLIVLPYQVLLSPQYIVVRETGLLGSPMVCYFAADVRTAWRIHADRLHTKCSVGDIGGSTFGRCRRNTDFPSNRPATGKTRYLPVGDFYAYG